MRTKPVEGVLRIDVTSLDPKPEIHIVYDGLAGISQRPVLRDIVDELIRKSPKEWAAFLEAIKRRAGTVTIEFLDYVSYGIGGGDATAAFPWPHTMLMWYEPARLQTEHAPGVPEHLVLRRNPSPMPAQELPLAEQQVERLPLNWTY